MRCFVMRSPCAQEFSSAAPEGRIHPPAPAGEAHASFAESEPVNVAGPAPTPPMLGGEPGASIAGGPTGFLQPQVPQHAMHSTAGGATAVAQPQVPQHAMHSTEFGTIKVAKPVLDMAHQQAAKLAEE